MPFTYTVQQGDTLNSIAQKHGFSNYKEAGISSVPSNNFDLIRAGEQITLGNYNPNEVKTFGSTPPVISSLDNKAEFLNNSDKITKIDNAFSGITAENKVNVTGYKDNPDGTTTNYLSDGTTSTVKYTKNADGTLTANEVQSSGDPVYDNLQKDIQVKNSQLELEQKEKRDNYENLYYTTLASLDASTNATINNIMASYDRRIKEQNRINQLNVDRTKAYGLANGGQYTPIEFGSAVSKVEQDASDRILSLENERNSLIAQAKTARDNGASQLLRQKLQDLDKVDADIRTQLQNVQAESDKKYQMLRDIRTAEEKKAEERRTKAIAKISSLAPMYSAEYEKMTPEQKDQFIKQIVNQTGLDYSTTYGALEAGMLKTKKDNLDLEGKTLDVKKKIKDLYSPKSGTKVTPEQMSADAPQTFSSEADFYSKMTAFVRKYGSAGATYWDKLYQKDSEGDYNYVISKEETKQNAPDVITKVINGKTVTLKKGADGKYYPQ